MPARKKTAAAAATEKTVEKTVKAPARKPAVKKTESVILQFAGKEAVLNNLTAQAKDAFVAAGHKAAEAKDIKVYVKPEEGKAYYVVNGDFGGELNLF
ncbi:MAG: DUF6465 family protein [Lachnospiraceae bacterium]